MAYDPSKDKIIKEFFIDDETDNTLSAIVYSYNDGPKKLSITRTYEKNGETFYNGKLGRLTKDEVAWIADNIENIQNAMED